MPHSSRTSAFIRRNVVGFTALFVALGGVGYAAGHQIGTDDIENLAVTTPKIAPEAVTGPKIAPEGVGTGRLADAAVTKDKIRDRAVRRRHVRNEAVNTLKLADGAVTSQKIGEIDDLFGAGQTGLGGCTADQGPQICAQTSIDLTRDSRVLVSMTGNWYVFGFTSFLDPGSDPDPDGARGECSLTLDGTDLANTRVEVGERRVIAGATPSSSGNHRRSLARTALTPVLPAGIHTFAVVCAETGGDGDIDWANMKLTAIMIPGQGGSVLSGQGGTPEPPKRR